MSLTCILVLLDGLGDRSYPHLGDKTPLQYASTPNLDHLARLGANGMLNAIRPGLSLPSENAHFALFGYDQQEFPGRGYLEGAGADIGLRKEDVALLAHFASVKQQENVLTLIKHRPKVGPDDAVMLAKSVARYKYGDIEATFHPTHGLDGIVRLRGAVSPHITDSDPLELNMPLLDVLPWDIARDDFLTAETALALRQYLLNSYTTLQSHSFNEERIERGELPVNAVITQRAGQWKEVESFTERWGLQAGSIASGLMYWGLASFLGMDALKVKDTADPGNDLVERLVLAKELSGKYDFIHVHTKAPDAAAHSKDPHNKVKAIESLDRGLGLMMDRLVDEETFLVITADHSTPSSGPLVHSGEPVPIAVVGPGIRRDAVSLFDEVSCAGGGLGHLVGEDFMYLVLNWLDRAKLQGLMDTPRNQPFWPGKRSPLLV